MDWTGHYPAFTQPKQADEDAPRMTREVEIADIGCGFGGLIVALSTLYPETLMLGKCAYTRRTFETPQVHERPPTGKGG